MKYTEMLERLWQERKTKHYEISNEEDNLNYQFSYGFIGRVCFENSAVYYINNSDYYDLQFPLPLFLLKSDKWEIKNPRPLEPDDLFYEEEEEVKNGF